MTDVRRNGVTTSGVARGLKQSLGFLLPTVGKAEAVTRRRTRDQIAEYNSLYEKEKAVALRQGRYAEQVTNFYDISTDFYEFGWGPCFHFFTLHPGEKAAEAIVRDEYYAVHRMGVRDHDRLLDIGSGVGGPAINIARLFPDLQVVGVNIDAYQIKKARTYAAQSGLHDRVSFVHADFLNTGLESESFDGAYAFGSVCHAPDKLPAYREIYRQLKPGACFASYEWCTTDNYDESNDEHRRIRYGIEKGNCLPALDSTQNVLDPLRDAGFDVLDSFDMAPFSPIPWYIPLTQGTTLLQRLQISAPARPVTHALVWLFERFGIVPTGSVEVSLMLRGAADNLSAGGALGIFTPMFFFLARKPGDRP